MASTREQARACPRCTLGRLYLMADSLRCDRCLHTEPLSPAPEHGAGWRGGPTSDYGKDGKPDF